MRALYKQPDGRLRYLIRSRLATALRRDGLKGHGALRWAKRLMGDVTQWLGTWLEMLIVLKDITVSLLAELLWYKQGVFQRIKEVTCAVRCGIYRQGHHDKVSVEELSWVPSGTCAVLLQGPTFAYSSQVPRQRSPAAGG